MLSYMNKKRDEHEDGGMKIKGTTQDSKIAFTTAHDTRVGETVNPNRLEYVSTFDCDD